MALIALTVNEFSSGSLTQTLVSADTADGNKVADYNGKQFLVVRNDHATQARTVTINSIEPCSQGQDHNFTLTIAGNATPVERIIKLPAPATRWRNSSGELEITYSDAGADIKIGAFKWPE